MNIRPAPTLRQLQSAQAVARNGHFGRAARSLGLTQPTVSADIRNLEKVLGCTLFHRSSAGSVLTAEGEELLSAIDVVLRNVEHLQAAARRLATSPQGVVRIAATPSVSNLLLPALLRINAAQAEPLRIAAVDARTGEIASLVENNLADIGIGHYVETRPGLCCERIGDDELHVLARPALLGEETMSVADLRGVPMLQWPRRHNPEYFDRIMDICRQGGYEPEIIEGSSRLSGATSWILEEGKAFALVPAAYAARARAPLASCPLTPPATIRTDMTWRASGSRYVPVIREYLRAVCG